MSVSCSLAVAQSKPDSFTPYGYSKAKREYIIDTAKFAVQYLRTQKVIRDDTGETVDRLDTLTLAVGTDWSVFCSPLYTARWNAWGQSNGKKCENTRQYSMDSVPISSVITQKESSEDYSEGDFGEPATIYTNHKTATTISCLYPIKRIMTEQEIKEFHSWTICEGTDVVLDHQCFKAQVNYAGRDYVAWFTMEIPASIGPWKFYGLPGLILKVEDSEGLFRFEAIGVENLVDSYITIDDNLERTKLDYFNKMADDRRSNLIGTFTFGGKFFSVISHPYTYTEMEL